MGTGGAQSHDPPHLSYSRLAGTENRELITISTSFPGTALTSHCPKHQDTRERQRCGGYNCCPQKARTSRQDIYIYTTVTLCPKAANQCSKSWGEQGLGQPSPGSGKRSNGKGGIQGPGSRARGGEAHRRAPAAAANRRVTHPAQGAAEPLPRGMSFMGYCPIFLRSWWLLAPPAKLSSSSRKVSRPTSCGEVWLV